MAQKKHKRQRCCANGVSMRDKLARERAIREAIDSSVLETKTRFVADRQTQRALWMATVAASDVFGAGPVRIQRWLQRMEEIGDEYYALVENADEQYADEKLRQRAAEISGKEIRQMYQAEADAAWARSEKKLMEERV